MTFWSGKRVLITGHTGFKGAWLTLWLLKAGAHVTGIALEPNTKPSLFRQLDLARDVDHRVLDVRDRSNLSRSIIQASPDVIFHLAAQSLVLQGYSEPVDTWTINVIGTIHVLDALRSLERPCAAVIVTTDKVYENREWEYGYRENDPLGGHDPYSASKAAAEIAISCWRRSLMGHSIGVRIASARAGNVIGGGDWALNRILPDIVRALAAGKSIEIRNRHATRPWQHVLEPLGGYLHLAELLLTSGDAIYQDAFNFGPDPEASRTVGELVEECLKHWPGSAIDKSSTYAPHEADNLALVIERSRNRLKWTPRWDFGRGIAETMTWYKNSFGLNAGDLRDFTVAQIHRFEGDSNAAK